MKPIIFKWNHLIFLTLLLINSFSVFSQGAINLLGGIDLSGNGYTYARHRNVLRSGDYDDGFIIYNLNGALQYRPNQNWSMDLGLQNVEFLNQVLDTQYLTRHPENKTSLLNLNKSISLNTPLSNLGFDKYYRTYFFQVTRYLPVTRSSSVYISLGLSKNYLHHGSYPRGTNSFYDSKNNELLQFNYSMINNYWGYIFEAGWNSLLFRGKGTFYIGFRYLSGFQKVLMGDYTDVQNNILINKDHIFTNGTYMGMVIKLGINLVTSKKLNPDVKLSNIRAPHFELPKISLPKIRHREQDPIKKEKSEDEKVNESNENKIVKEKTERPLIKDTIQNTLENREMLVKHHIVVKSMTITVKAWDHDKIDDDVISLYLNNQWVLKKYTLKEDPIILSLELKNGLNYLVLHADNMGLYTPCTSAFLIDDGISQQQVIIDSTTDSSGTIEIELK